MSTPAHDASPIAVAHPIPYSVVRRVNRVRERITPEEEDAEEILDDIFVLCRAFEATWRRPQYSPAHHQAMGERRLAETAVVECIDAIKIHQLHTLKPLLAAMNAYTLASEEECAEWFLALGEPRRNLKAWITDHVRSLQRALGRPGHWDARKSKLLGYLIYKMRCAVVHPNLNTDNRLATTILPALREALIELTIARAAYIYRLSLPESKRRFDALLLPSTPSADD